MNAQTSTAENIDTHRGGAHRTNQERSTRTDSSELTKLLADIDDLLSRAAVAADIDVASLRRRVAWKLSSAASTLAEGGKRVGATARDAARATDGYVREKPWQAVGAAAIAGAAIGFVLARR